MKEDAEKNKLMKKYIYGINPVIEALNTNNIVITELIVQAGKENKRIKQILNIADKKNISICRKDKGELDFVYNKNHQGIVALVSNFAYKNLNELLSEIKDNRHAKLLFIDSIEDPQNLGALIRSACAFFFDGVVIQEKRSAAITASAIKASSGTVFHIPVCLVKNLNNALKTVKDNGYWTVGTALNADKYIHDLDMDMKIALVIGNEEKGIRSLVAKNCDFLVKIPISRKVNSLNASAAGACVMYEITRQQGA
jgi:23S rRNA (guanosine2251-2'-O)-methyltransferase